MLKTKVHKAEVKVKNILDICRSCSGLAFGEEVRCDSRDCPVFYSRVKERAALGSLRERTGGVVGVLEGRIIEGIEW